ncbi:hypothetical protein DFQ04_1868 [Algoriphagus boseongensis]|uniref:Outer membrane protein with beta-barrel domain n=1 Tax=Algoriphagus boseongensis TaxID=1442587 RepID=A0A4R6T6N5_9BACT|nr:hypothetical protein [Algoriphagus boseongensis]TDQ17216.1 hypothetical protein DFQ04_1868 [Algoriphagus boseongensis]
MRYILILFFGLVSFGQAFSQVQVGVYHSGLSSQVGVGTNIEKKFFGEIRFLATDRLELDFGAEAIGQYNFYQSEWYNLHGGLMIGYYGDGAVGLPFGATIKPISAFQRLGILMEATPYILSDQFFLRGNIGLRMRLGGD